MTDLNKCLKIGTGLYHAMKEQHPELTDGECLHVIHALATRFIKGAAEDQEDGMEMAEWLAHHIPNFIREFPIKG